MLKWVMVVVGLQLLPTWGLGRVWVGGYGLGRDEVVG